MKRNAWQASVESATLMSLLTKEQPDRCTGTFRLSPEFTLTLERRNLALFVTPTGQPADRLYATSPDKFFSRRVLAE